MEKKKYHAHTVYKLANGKRVPGVTTITGVMNKPALVRWANKLGLEGIDSTKYVDSLADAGTLAHKMVEDHLMERKTSTNEYTKDNIDMAENAVLKFFEWEKSNKVEVIQTEMALISEVNNFGGTCDIYCKLNGVLTLIDLKTCKAIWPEQFTQVVAYKKLLEENGYRVDDVRILRIGRDESEGFEDRKVPSLALHWERFELCLKLYELNKILSK